MPKTGATRYQKFMKSEKSKTKLKAKKDLPRGTNVTKTNFKIKKIVLKEQLKKHDGTEALSTRKLNVKELLSRLNHFNTHSRSDALHGLKEVINSHPQLLERNFRELVYGVTPLISNIEKNIRHEALQVLHLMLSYVSLEKADPFFDIMCTYLRSAMTHIDNRIQEDSLLFLDTLLVYTPRKLAQDFHKVIPNFLDMISKLRVDSNPGRTLTVNLGSQMTSVKWRVKVLHRLQAYLHQFVKYNNIFEEDKPAIANAKIFDVTKMNHYSLFNPNYVKVCYVSCFSSKNSEDVIPIDEVEKFKEYIDTLIPLLFETWLEVCPIVHGDKNIETVITEDAASLLKHTLEVISLIWKLIKHLNIKHPSSNMETLFTKKYCQPYLQHFVHLFPYVTNLRSKQRKANTQLENTVSDSKLVIENLEICHLFIIFNPHINIKNQNKYISSVLNYIEKTFNHNTQGNVNDVIIRILHSIFADGINNWTKTMPVMDGLFRKIIWAYFNKEIVSSFRQNIFNLLCKIALNDKLHHLHQCDAYDMWLKNLPDILLEESVKVQTIDIIHKFAVQNNATFNAVVKPKLLKIIENLPIIVITDNGTNMCSYRKLYSLLYYIQSWDGDSLNLLENQLLNNVYKHDYGNFIFDTLRLRTGGI